MSRTDEELLSAFKLAMLDTWWLPPENEIVDNAEILCIVGSSTDCTVLQVRAADKSTVLKKFVARSKGRLIRAVTHPGDSPALFTALRENGFRPHHNHDICALRLAGFVPRQHSCNAAPVLSWNAQLEGIKITDAVFGGESRESSAALQHLLNILQAPRPRVARFIARHAETGLGLGTGGISLFEELGLALLFGGCVLEEHRGQGVYSALLDARLTLAQARGFDAVGIYARHGTSAPIVERLGFEKLGEMQYWKRTA